MLPEDNHGRPIIGKHKLDDDEYEIVILNYKLFSNTEYKLMENQIGIPVMADSESMCCRLKFETMDILVKEGIRVGHINMNNIHNITGEFVDKCRENIEKIQRKSKKYTLKRGRESRENEREYFKKQGN